MWLSNRPRTAAQMVAASPHHYRRLVDAAWSALSASGHGGDHVLIGETAPRGGKKPSQIGNAIPPAEFVRELFCLKRNFRPYTGRAARLRGCPATAAARGGVPPRRTRACSAPTATRFTPTASTARGWRLPTWRHPLRDNVPIANLRHMTRTLDRAAFFWGSTREPLPSGSPSTATRPRRPTPSPASASRARARSPRGASTWPTATRAWPRSRSSCWWTTGRSRRPGEQPQELDHLAVGPLHPRRARQAVARAITSCRST